MMTNEQKRPGDAPAAEDNWADLVQRHIVEGKSPVPRHPWEVETPEIYLARRYIEADRPEALRTELVNTLKDSLQKNVMPAFGRALGLVMIIPHMDFDRILREIYFRIQNKGLETQYGDAELQVFRAMHALQSELSVEERPPRVAWWLYLVEKDPKFGIAAYQGLRELDPLLALSHLNLLLQRDDLPGEGLEVLLDGLVNDALREKEKSTGAREDLVDELASAIAQLSGERFFRHQSALKKSFGDDLDKAVVEAQELVTARMAQTSGLLNSDNEKLTSLRDRLFPGLAAWLRDQMPVSGVSIWLRDRAKKQVHFMGQAGCPGEDEPFPPRILDFGEGASGKVAKRKRSEFFDLTLPDCPVYKHDEFLELGIEGLFSVFERTHGDVEPQFQLVINFFDSSLDRLRSLEKACAHLARTAVFICERLLDIYTKRWVAHLTTELSGKPTLPEIAQTFVKDVSDALACDRIALYLFQPDVRRLFLQDTFPSVNGFGDSHSERRSINYALGEGLCGRTALAEQPVRVANATDQQDLEEFNPELNTKAQHLDLGDLSSNVHWNYLGVSLRSSAPEDFAGLLVGVIEMYRRVDSQSARVYTPLSEYVFGKLAKTATTSLENAYDDEKSPVVLTVEEMFGKLKGPNAINEFGKIAEDTFQREVEKFLSSWGVVGRAKRHFFAFRSDPLPYDVRRTDCKAFWPGGDPPDFTLEELLARKALRERILASVDFPHWNNPAVAVGQGLLSTLRVDEKHWQEILKLGMTIVPLVEDRLLTGIIALEFYSTQKAAEYAEKIKQQKELRRFVSESLLRIWEERIGYFQTMVGTLNAHIWRRAENEHKVDSWKDVLDYIRIGPAFASRSNTFSTQPEELFNGLAKDTLQRTEPVGAECSLRDVCEEWQSFVSRIGHGRLENKIKESAKLMAMSPAVRMMLASATAVVLWGGTAKFSLLEDSLEHDNDGEAGWRRLQIRVSSNGNGNDVIRRQGLDLAKGITNLKGWAYEEKKNGIIIVTLPRL